MSFTHTIKTHEANQRLDHFLFHNDAFRLYADSRSLCTAHIRNKLVFINALPAKPSSVLKTGDTITCSPHIPMLRTTLLPQADLPLTTLFEDDHLLALSKPAGIAMHPTQYNTQGTVAHWIIAHYPSIASVGENSLRPGIVHRLDKNTSGVFLVAKTQSAFLELKKHFSNRSIQKTYLALVHGLLNQKTGVIESPLAKSLTGRKQTVVDTKLKAKGKIRSAQTQYTVLETFKDCTLVSVQPKTGRMHQIRVHFSSIGHPLIGDALYGNKQTRSTEASFSQIIPRQLLHASTLQCTLFETNYTFTAPLPADFQAFLDHIRTEDA